MSGTRGIEESIEIRATPESVWAALTDADQITRWFAPSAAATPGVGGALDLQWGAEVSWPMVIRVWDPPRHVRLEDRYAVIDALKYGTLAELFIDYFVEPKGGGVTRLRVVHSGFSGED